MEAGRWAPELQSIPTLREVIQEYRQVVAPKLKGASTYRYRFDEFERLPFANLSVNEIQSAHLARWRDQQAERLKAGTVIRKLAMLSSVFRWAQMERGWVDSNPLSTVRRPRSDQGRSRTLSSLETEWLLHAAKSSKASWLHPALIVLMRSAMRRGELCQLRIRDIDSAQATAFLADTKNGSARYVPLCPQSLAALL
ncbi:MAG: tyrosine-type recombinase/integrase, partial [Paucibacter sp.]|nr:tyrosine-type recombinase/integrase [Roseateles sp.]